MASVASSESASTEAGAAFVGSAVATLAEVADDGRHGLVAAFAPSSDEGRAQGRDAAIGGGTPSTCVELDPGLRGNDEVVDVAAAGRPVAEKRATSAKDVRKAGSAKRKGPAARRRTVRGKRRITRWSQKREDIFIATLEQSINVAASIRASGLSETNVYRKRRQSAEFRARWAEALREGFVQLEARMLERALHGVEKPVWHGGKQVGTVVEYNDRMALALLTAHRATVTGEKPMAADEPIEALRERVKEKLAEMNRRMGGEG